MSANESDKGIKVLAMPPTQLLILGSPAAGTPLMLAAPGTALDLPLKVLAWPGPGLQDLRGADQ
jgi:uncharacterized protein (DUF302 family)